MPNFNTKEMKVAIATHKDSSSLAKGENVRLPDKSIEKLIAAIDYCIDEDRDVTIVFSFVGYFIHEDDFKKIRTFLDDEDVAIVVNMADLIVLRTEDEECVITIKFVGGAEGLNRKNKKTKFERGGSKQNKMAGNKLDKGASDDDSDEDAGGLTQECMGIY